MRPPSSGQLLATAAATLLLLAALPSTQADLTPSVLTQWLDLLKQHIQVTTPTTHMQAAKYFAAMTLSAYNALNTNQQSGKVDDNAVAAFACHTILNHYYPHRYFEHDILIRSQIENLPSDVQAKASQIGTFEANKVIASRVADGFDVWADWQQPPIAPGVWRPLPTNTYEEFPQWGNMKPFIINSNDVTQVTAASVAAFNSAGDNNGPYYPSQKYYGDLKYTYDNGGTPPSPQADPSLPPYAPQLPPFWNDGSGTSTALGHWVSIAMKALPDNLSLFEQARFFAALTTTIFDATIPCFRVKYQVNLWRPYSGITLGDDNQKPLDTNWKPVLNVPPHPSYPSGHSCISGAASQVLASYLGTDSCSIVGTSEGSTFVQDGNNGVPKFTTFSGMAKQAGLSRVLGGLHYRNDCDAGLALGQAVAQIALKSWKINSLPVSA